MLDLHAHLLPAIDDGPPDVAGSLEFARVAVESGTTLIVATPHVSWRYQHVESSLIDQRVEQVREALAGAGIDLEVRAGAEVAATRGIDLPAEELAAVRLGDGPWLLLECPLEAGGVGFDTMASIMAGKGHRILLAHPERSPAFQRDPELLERLVGMGMLAQGTVGSFAGTFGRTVRTAALEMLERGLLHTIGSDAHSAHGTRGPALRPVLLEAGLGEEHVDVLCRDVPAAILAGEPIPAVPPWAPPKRGLLSRLRR